MKLNLDTVRTSLEQSIRQYLMPLPLFLKIFKAVGWNIPYLPLRIFLSRCQDFMHRRGVLKRCSILRTPPEYKSNYCYPHFGSFLGSVAEHLRNFESPNIPLTPYSEHPPGNRIPSSHPEHHSKDFYSPERCCQPIKWLKHALNFSQISFLSFDLRQKPVVRILTC